MLLAGSAFRFIDQDRNDAIVDRYINCMICKFVEPKRFRGLFDD